MRKILISTIRLYRYAISPFMANRCRFTPSCSEYSIEAIEKFGVIKGSWMSLKRILSCHPWGNSGYDPVPHDH